MNWKRALAVVGCIVAACCYISVAQESGQGSTVIDQAEADARGALESYFEAFNEADNDALQGYMNYPHAFVGANGSIRVMDERFDINFDRMNEDEGWHHSTLDFAQSFLVKEDKVHFNIVFSRHRADNSAYRTVEGLWIMTRQDGHWGLSLRSY